MIKRTRTKIDTVSKTKSQNDDRTIDRVVIVSNRLPIVIEKKDGKGLHIKPGQGGLVTALAPVLRDRGGLWIGWPGTAEDFSFDPAAFQKQAFEWGAYIELNLEHFSFNQDSAAYLINLANQTDHNQA